MKRCDKITKNIQRKLLDYLQTKQGLTFLCLSIFFLFIYFLHISETLVEYHFHRHDKPDNRQHIDVVYTWVNGSDPKHLNLLKKYKYYNTSIDFKRIQVKDYLDSNRTLFCHYKFCINPNNLIVITPKLTAVDKQHFLLKSKTLLDPYLYSNLTLDSFDDILHSNMAIQVSNNITLLTLNHHDFYNKTTIETLHTLFKITLLNKHYKFYIGYYTIDCETSPNCVQLNRTYVAKKYRERPVTHDYMSFNTAPLVNKIELPKLVRDNLIFENEFEYQPEILFDPSLETKKDKVKRKTDIRLKVFKVKSKEAEFYVQQNLNVFNSTLDIDFYKTFLVWDLGNPMSDDVSLNRFQDNNELKYSLRSLEKYAPWVRNVYLVTNGQVPNWLNLTHPKINLVNHTSIFTNLTHLPTFSSSAIEAHIHRIKGLSDRFLYFNDDVLLGRPVFIDDFVTESKGFKFHLAWQLPGCNPSCPNSWIRDGYCDKACNTTECDFDGGDCDTSNKNSNPNRNQFLNQSHLITSDFYCSPGCSTSWLADKYCDHPCNNMNCGYDLGDCGIENYKNLYQLKISELLTKMDLETPRNITAFFLNFTEIDSFKVIKSEYEESKSVRGVSAVNKFKVLTVLLMPKIESNNVKIRLEYSINNQTSNSEINIKLNNFDLVVTTKTPEVRTTKILNLLNLDPKVLNTETFTDYSLDKKFNFKLFDDLYKNYVGFLNWSLANEFLTESGYRYKIGYFNKKISELETEFKNDADPINFVYQYLFKDPFMEKNLVQEYLNKQTLDDTNVLFKFRKRKLLDTFADSLKNVNKLYNKIYGFSARKVPAHIPHFIDKTLMENLQEKFKQEFMDTSSHRFRTSNDMQFSFSYYYYVMSEFDSSNASVLFDELDSNQNGVLDDLEIRLINLRLYPKKFDLTDFEFDKLRPEFDSVLNECLNTTKVLVKAEVLKCKNLVDYLSEKFWPGLPSEERPKRFRHKFESLGDEDTKFIMISGNAHDVEVKLNNLLRAPVKFICLNDNIDYKLYNEAQRLKNLIHTFYEMMFPMKSSFEKNEGYQGEENIEEKNNFVFILFSSCFVFVLVLCVLKRVCTRENTGKLRRFRRDHKVSNALRKRMEKKTETSSLTSSDYESDSRGSFKKNFGLFMRSKFRTFKKSKKMSNLNTI